MVQRGHRRLAENDKQEFTNGHSKNALNTKTDGDSHIVVVHEWMTNEEANTINLIRNFFLIKLIVYAD